MDRSTRVIKKIISESFISFWIWACICATPFAGVIIASPAIQEPAHGTSEDFPESRFGSSPQPPDLGSTRDVGSSGSRSPAGLEFSRETGQIQSAPVIPEEGLPTSSANNNPKPSTSNRQGVQEVALIAGDLGFFPKTLFVTRNIPVRIFVTGASKKPLCLMMDSFQIRKQVRPQKIEEISFTPTASGQYRFYCPVNGMEGTLLVKELSTIVSISSSGITESDSKERER